MQIPRERIMRTNNGEEEEAEAEAEKGRVNWA